MKTKVKASAGSCRVFVSGMDMNCPLCGTLVRSGEPTHYCEIRAEKTNHSPKKRKKK